MGETKKPFQFGLASLFGLMIVAAVSAAVLRFFPPMLVGLSVGLLLVGPLLAGWIVGAVIESVRPPESK